MLAGIFVLGSIALGIAVVILLSDLKDRFAATNRYIVRFSLVEGAEGLRPGSQVKVGGHPVGRVVTSEFARGDSGEPVGVDVEIEVRAALVFYEDAVAQLVMPLLGSSSQINFPDLGDGSGVPGGAAQGGDPRLQSGEILRGQLAAPGFLAQAGYGDEQREQVQQILRNMADASERIGAITQRIDGEIDPTLAELRGILADARAVTSDARTQWPAWRGRIDASLSSLNGASERVNEILESIRTGVEDARTAIAANRARVDTVLRNVEEVTGKANTEGWEMVRAMLDRGARGVDEFAHATERINGIVRESAPELRTLVANARLASDQLKLTAAEVRAAPWKLLSRPTGRRELENEVLYDAARQYAQAVSDLRAASASLESVAAASPSGGGEGRGPLEQGQIARLVAELDAAFARYQQAERAFLQRLTDTPRN